MATAPAPSPAQGACPEGTSATGSHPRGYPIPDQISKEYGWFLGAPSPPGQPALPLLFPPEDPEGLPTAGARPSDLPTSGQPPGSLLPQPT